MDTRILDDATLNKYSYTLNNSNTALNISGWQPIYVNDFPHSHRSRDCERTYFFWNRWFILLAECLPSEKRGHHNGYF